MKNAEHLDNGSLIQYLDGELPENQFVRLRTHLLACAACKRKMDEFARLSTGVEALVAGESVSGPASSRHELARALTSDPATQVPAQNPARVIRRFAWGMAIAASFAVGILLAPRTKPSTEAGHVKSAQAALTSIDVNGENFIALPYSNPDLPLNAPRIVEMQVPVSSLASAGILLEPVANGSGDRTVLANVLLGLDGQPLGVHVLSAE